MPEPRAERLTTSHDYWLATIREGRPPHLLPVWAVWHDDALWFSAGADSRKTRNLEPRWAFGLVEADFTGTPTRWVF